MGPSDDGPIAVSVLQYPAIAVSCKASEEALLCLAIFITIK